MDFIKGIIGLAVLSGPLWLIVLMVPVAIVMAVMVAKQFRNVSARFIAAAAVLLAFFLALFGDEIAGRMYFNHLCATEAGVKVYQTIGLPAEYWDEKGEARFFNARGYLDHGLWVKVLDESGGRTQRVSEIFAIDRDLSPVKQRESQKLLAEVSNFRCWGGWVKRHFSTNNVADSCAFINEVNFSRDLYGRIFKPETQEK